MNKQREHILLSDSMSIVKLEDPYRSEFSGFIPLLVKAKKTQVYESIDPQNWRIDFSRLSGLLVFTAYPGSAGILPALCDHKSL